MRLVGLGIVLISMFLALNTGTAASEKRIFFHSDALPGTSGEREDWIAVHEFGQILVTEGSPEDQGVTILKSVDETSPYLALLAASGDHLPDLTLAFIDPSNPTVPFLRVVLEQVTVSSIMHQAESGENAYERVAFRFRRIDWIYTKFLMWGDEEGLEYHAFWDFARREGGMQAPEDGFIPDGAFKAFRSGLIIERVPGDPNSLKLSWPAIENAIYDIYASTDLHDGFETHLMEIESKKDGLTGAIIEGVDEFEKMFFIVRKRLD